jgi:hypothetical protein
VKEEPQSPAQPAPRKRKARPSVDAGTLSTCDHLEDDVGSSTQSVGKRTKISASTSNVRFDGVIIPAPKPTRRSTRVAKMPKKDVVGALRHFEDILAVASRAAGDLADTME